MGSVKFDTEKGARSYSVKYNLESSEGVEKLLRDIEVVSSSRFSNADYDASDILIDLNAAVGSAGLTGQESEAIAHLYLRNRTRKEAALAMGLPVTDLTALIDSAHGKIAVIYQRWEYGDVYASGPDAVTDYVDDADVGQAA
ncbi:RNA polymerase subunit sigma [Paenibacillus sp. FSL R10-2779]|uniref:RNA polymerase subunit sigma n=1 Tax=Paenibacillus sp. FSL R10-2779 TaxID=2975340 RepID=UPI0030F6A7D2